MEQPPSRRSIVRLLLAALVATASCVSVFGLEEENYESLEDELCNYAAELCSEVSTFSLSECLAGKTFDLSDNNMSGVDGCFAETDCQAFINCVPNNKPQGDCDQPCTPVGEPCSPSECPEQCCSFAQCNGGRCCWSDQEPCSRDEECCNAPCLGGICGGCIAALEPCESSEQCCQDRECMETGGPPKDTLCTKGCSVDSECGEFTDSCCDWQTGQCRADQNECCNFAGNNTQCLTDALGLCEDKAGACCDQGVECIGEVMAAAACPDAACVETALHNQQAIEFADCACVQNKAMCGLLCAPGSGGGGSGGMGGSSTSGGGGSGG